MNVQQLQSQDLATYPGGIIRNYEEDLGRYSEKHLIQKIERKERKNQDATTQKAELAEVPAKRAILQKEISRRDNKLRQERLQKLDTLFTQHGKEPETIVRILDPNRHRSLGYSTIRLKQYLRNVNSQLLQKRLTTPWKKTEIAELRDRQAFLETYLKENRNVDV
jgi:cell division protein FtsB